MTIDLERVELHPTSGAVSLVSLEQVSSRFRAAGDPRASFPDIYGLITLRAAEEVERSPCGFVEPAWISRLMGRFCERYLETLVWSLEGRPQDCSAWAIAYRYAATGCTIPFQDVVLGLSAHINYDLALGISATIREFGGSSDPEKLARYKHDHDYVNVLLRASIPESFERLSTRYGCRTSGLLWTAARPVVMRLVMATLASWRELVWAQVLALLAADTASERARVLSEMDRRSGRIGLAIVAGNFAWLQGRELLPAPVRRRVRSLVLRERLEHGFAAPDHHLELDGLRSGLLQ